MTCHGLGWLLYSDTQFSDKRYLSVSTTFKPEVVTLWRASVCMQCVRIMLLTKDRHVGVISVEGPSTFLGAFAEVPSLIIHRHILNEESQVRCDVEKTVLVSWSILLSVVVAQIHYNDDIRFFERRTLVPLERVQLCFVGFAWYEAFLSLC